MPLLNRLEFAQNALQVRYRAAPAPQRLIIHVEIAGEPHAAFAHWPMNTIMTVANHGAAGSDVFPPTDSSVKVLRGPMTEPEVIAAGRHYEWILEVTALAPRYIGFMVEELRRCGFDVPIVGISILGELPIDQSDLSITEAHVKAWLDDPHAYPRAWPAPPFPVTIAPRSDPLTDAWFRVALADPITPEIRDALELQAVVWMNASRNYVTRAGLEYYVDPNITLPTCAQALREFRARYKEFRYCEDAGALLINMMVRFHAVTAKLVELELCP